MKAYRESYPSGLGRRGLTQEELLHRMADQDASLRPAVQPHDRFPVGVRSHPSTVERLRVFGKALDLSDEEVSG